MRPDPDLDKDPADSDQSGLRTQAIARATILVQQLAADRDDLERWAQRHQSAAMQPGVGAVARVMETARRVCDRLQGG